MKRFTFKRITSLVLALIMMLSLCPVTAGAAVTAEWFLVNRFRCWDPYNGSAKVIAEVTVDTAQTIIDSEWSWNNSLDETERAKVNDAIAAQAEKEGLAVKTYDQLLAEAKENAAVLFVDAYTKDRNGVSIDVSVPEEISDYNLQIICSGIDAWNKLSSSDQEKVNSILVPLTYEEMLFIAVRQRYNAEKAIRDFLCGNTDTPYETLDIEACFWVVSGERYWNYLDDDVKTALNVATNENFSALRDQDTTLAYMDVVDAANFMLNYLRDWNDGTLLITALDEKSSADAIRTVTNGEKTWNSLTAVQRTVVNKSLKNADANAQTYEEMLEFAAVQSFISVQLCDPNSGVLFTTATFDNAERLTVGKEKFDAMTADQQAAVRSKVSNVDDLLAAGKFIRWALHGDKYNGQHFIEITDSTSDRDLAEFIGGYDRLWGDMTTSQKAMVNAALVAVGGQYTVDELYTAAKAKQQENNGSSSTFGDPYTIEVVPLSVDDVVEKLTYNGTFDFSKSNPNLDSIEKIWAFYKGVDAGDGFHVICDALAIEYGTTNYGSATDPLTVEQGFNRVYHTGAFIAGYLSTIENPVYRWEHLVAEVEGGHLGYAFYLAQTKFAHDTKLSGGQKMLLKTYLETSMEDGYATAVSLIKNSSTADVVSAYLHRFLWDYKEQTLIVPDTVMLIREYDVAYGGSAQNPWNVIGGEEVYSIVLTDEQRAAVDALYADYNCTYPELLRLAQAYWIAHLDSNLSAENALAIVKSTEIGDALIKLINNALIYGRPVQLAISAMVTESMSATDKDALDNAVPSGYEVENYQDLGVTVTVDGQTTDVTETNGTVAVNVGKAEKGKDYKMLRKHGDKVDVLPVAVDEDGNLIVESDQFSSYALVSTDAGPSSDTLTKGDVNLDGEVNADDLTALARHVAKIETFSDADALANADVDDNGFLSADDLTKLARYVAKIIPSL